MIDSSPRQRQSGLRARAAWLTLTLSLCLVGAGCAPDGNRPVPEEAIRHNILGTAYMGQQKWSEADAEFRKALELRPDDPLLLNNRAVAAIQRAEIDEAEALLRKATEVDPRHLHAHYNLGLIENRRGNFEQAVEHFAVVAGIDPRDLFTQYFLGSALARTGREDQAKKALRAALAIDPDHVSSLYSLGRLLLQQGDQDEGMLLVTRSQEVRARSGLDEAVGGQYGEQGPYGMGVDYPGEALQAPPAIPVEFAPAAQVRLAPGPDGIPWTLVRIGESGPPTMLVAQRGTVLQLVPPGRSEPVAPPFGDGAEIVVLAAADVDNDGLADLVALVAGGSNAEKTLHPALMRQEDGGRFGAPTTDRAFEGDTADLRVGGAAAVDLVPVDRDHDGDLDLFWCWTRRDGGAAGCNLATNDGSGRFRVRSSSEHGFAPGPAAPGPVALAISDVDNDRDIDLLVAGPAGVQVFTNKRDGSFEDISGAAGLGSATQPVSALAVADTNKDGWMDLVIADPRPRLLLNRGGSFEPAVPLGAADTTAVGGGRARVAVLDFDNDGFLNVAASSTEGPVVFRNRGGGDWEPRPVLPAAAGAAGDFGPLAVLDADEDGDPDLVIADAEGVVSLLMNEGGNANRWIMLETRGVGDNKFGIGTKIEVLAGALRQKFEVTRPLPLVAGLGSRETVESARYLWPTGVLQDETGLDAGKTAEIAQLDRKGTSCPLLYAWRDGRWRFVTDFLGGCAIGYQQAPGVFSIPDTDEYVRIDGGLAEDDAGRLRLRVNNQLEEVIWFDKMELVVVDHPAGAEVYPNERLMPGPPLPDFRLFASSDIRPVQAARGVEDGRDLTDRLRRSDRRYADNFELYGPKGYAEPHTLELDLGPFGPRQRAVLLLDGWIDYADSSANVAAAQAGLKLVPPRLFVADGREGWTEIRDLMGFPAGLPKTMAVELTGRFPSTDHRVRIATSMRIYWDRARVMLGGEQTALRVTRLGPETAELRFGGYPRETSPDGDRPFGYDPEDVAVTHAWKAHVGAYTPFGDVADLIAEIDDGFVTTKHGDEIELTFRSPGPPARGRARTYLLYADGFGKDMDPNSAANNEVGPIPFHGMPPYPYAANVVPPSAPDRGGPPPRRILPSSSGWPGAVPQPLVPGPRTDRVP